MRAISASYYKSSILMLLISLISVSSAFAEKMDLDTHTAVIDKLANIVKDLDDGDPSKVPSALRLADLLADRSRLKALKEVEQNCQNCLKAKEDRRSAVGYYSYAIPKLDGHTRSQAMLQKAHLQFALGERNSAEAEYQKIIREGKKKHEATVLGQTHASLGDFYFQKGQYKTSRQHFEKALAIPETKQKGIIHYRLAWCLFNLGKTNESIAKMEMILTTPKMTEMVNSKGDIQQDESFKIDVAKDLSGFYAKSTVTRNTVNKLMKLSPESQRQQNLFTLGTETDRLGKKKESAMVWMVYLDNSPEDKGTLEPQIRLMKLKRDTGDVAGSMATFNHIAELWKKPGCGEKCDDLQSLIRKFVTGWNKEEKKNKTAALVTAYTIYANIFPQDEEVIFQGAAAAMERKQFQQAFEFYRRAATIAHHKLDRPKDMNAEQIKTMKLLFEASLIGEIDMAETSKNHDLRLQAYSHYLELNPKGPREFEVRYQIAQTEFEKKNFDKSATLFKALALEKNAKDKSLQKTAADMSISSLIKLKNEEAIEKWSAEYIHAFPKHKVEFAKTNRKAVQNLTASRINQKKADQNDLMKLRNVSLIGSTSQERINIYKNRYLLAIQLHNFPEAKSANQELLSVKDLDGAERAKAWKDRIWLAEMELDFKVAYHLAVTHSDRNDETEALRLIMLAQLAGASAEKHENDFLRRSNNKAMRATIIAKRVQRSKRPDVELKKHMAELSHSPDTLAKLTLEVYARTGNQKLLEKSFDYSSVRRTINAPIIGRLIMYPGIEKQISSLRRSRLKTRTDKALQKSLNERLNLLQSMERTGQVSIKNRDIVMQAIVLDVLMYENDRLHKEILALPAPRGLKGPQLAQYQTLVAEQAAPYKRKADSFAVKLHGIWSDSSWTDALAKNYIEARSEYKPALRKDLSHLLKHAPSERAAILTLAMNEKTAKPSEREVIEARAQVKKNPFEASYVDELKNLEIQRGNDVLVAHLEARINQLKGVRQ